jgi:hypothetical protein
MALTYNAIATTTLSSTATSISFSGIPSGYTDLRIVASLIEQTSDNIYVRMNGITFGYNQMTFGTRGSDSQNFSFNNSDFVELTGFAGNWPSPMMFELHIPQYSINQPKNIFYRQFLSDSSAGSFGYSVCATDSSFVLNSINFYTQSAVNFLAGSRITLYGILKA